MEAEPRKTLHQREKFLSWKYNLQPLDRCHFAVLTYADHLGLAHVHQAKSFCFCCLPARDSACTSMPSHYSWRGR